MAGFSSPSFSLGLDLDSDATTEEEEEGKKRDDADGSDEGVRRGGPLSHLGCASSSGRRDREEESEEEDDVVLGTLGEDPPVATPALKRLRRGPPPPPQRRQPPPPPDALLSPAADTRFKVVDDEIEEFSSQEDSFLRDDYSSIHNHSACGSSKFSLRSRGVLTTQSTSKLKAPKITPASYGSTSTSLEASSNKKLFPKLTVSPLKRIQLLDSDSDDLSLSEDKCKNVVEVDYCPNDSWFDPKQSLSGYQQKKAKFSSTLQGESFWKDFSPEINTNLATPALDEFCEEYSRSMDYPDEGKHPKKSTDVINSRIFGPNKLVDGESCISNNAEQCWNMPDPQPPAYQYFYHNDDRVQKLVQVRLCNFLPLGDAKYKGIQQSETEALDYMNQFGPKKVPNQVHKHVEKGLLGSSKDRKRNGKNVNCKEVSHASGSWVNTRSFSTNPKDAGKRRVSADHHSSGHWYTGQDGRKVYITKNGQELSGRIAYQHYRKESGAGFRKPRKKAAAGKKKIPKK